VNLTALPNTCTGMYLSNINSSVAAGKEGIEKAKKMISDRIANNDTCAILATASADEQRVFLRALGFKRLRSYDSHRHTREVFVYMRTTSKEEFKAKKGIF